MLNELVVEGDCGLRLARSDTLHLPTSLLEGKGKTAIRLVRAIASTTAVALADTTGGIHLLGVNSGRVDTSFQTLASSFTEETGARTADQSHELGFPFHSNIEALPTPARAVRLPWTQLAFLPDTSYTFFGVFGEGNVIMRSSLSGGGSTAIESSVCAIPLSPLRGHKSCIQALAINHEGSVMASGDRGGMMRLWALGSEEKLDQFISLNSAGEPPCLTVSNIRAHDGPVGALSCGQALTEGRGDIISAGSDGLIRVWAWELHRAKSISVELRYTLIADKYGIDCLDASPATDLILGGSSNQTLQCWSISTGRLLYTDIKAGQAIRQVMIIPRDCRTDDPLLVAADAAGIIKLYRSCQDSDSWAPIAESPAGAPLAGLVLLPGCSNACQAKQESILVAVTATGSVTSWPVRKLPASAKHASSDVDVNLLESCMERRDSEIADQSATRAEHGQARQLATTGEMGQGLGAEVRRASSHAVAEQQQDREVDEEEMPRTYAPLPSVITQHDFLPDLTEDDEHGEHPRTTPPPRPIPIRSHLKEHPPRTGQVLIPTYKDRKRTKSALPGPKPRDAKADEEGRTQGGCLPADLAGPALNSTMQLQDLLACLQRETFDEAKVPLSDTSSIIAEAARTLNLEADAKIYSDVSSRNHVDIAPARPIQRQVDAIRIAKQSLQPQADDFYTPDLEAPSCLTSKDLASWTMNERRSIEALDIDPFPALYQWIR